MASNPITESCNKHIDIWYHAIQDFVTQGKVKLFYLEDNKNPADMFTKNLEQVKFCKFRGQLCHEPSQQGIFIFLFILSSFIFL